MSISLAVKYRPKTFDDLTEQGSVKTILTNQINAGEIKNGYLFAGGAGTGKTTSARIFASMINNGKGMPIELDAASNNSVDDIRRITEDAQTQSIDSEYKVFILDEVHSLSSQAWQAFLKTLEEPPAKSVFILCTTNPEKIPATILSRVQRYTFKRISHEGIVKRLEYILGQELEIYDEVDYLEKLPVDFVKALEYIARVADGGMRDAITLLDKCLAYSHELTVDNVVRALGLADYDSMFVLNDAMLSVDYEKTINVINEVYASGVDLKLFIKTYFEFLLDLCMYHSTQKLSNTRIPDIYKKRIEEYGSANWYSIKCVILPMMLELSSEVKWETNPKYLFIAKSMIAIDSVEVDR